MSKLLQEVAAPALMEMGVRFLIDPITGSLVVPFETGTGTRLLITFDADDDAGDAIIFTTLAAVPPSRVAAVAVLLAELNGRFSYTAFSMAEGAVRVDICVPLGQATSPQAILRGAYERLRSTIEETQHLVARTARARQRRPRVLRQAEQIIEALDRGQEREGL